MTLDRDDARRAAAERVHGELGRVVRLVEHRRTRPLVGADLERAAYRLLATVARHGPARTGALAALVHADSSTVSRQVADLVRDGHLTRVADPVDGRASLVALTPRGRETVDRQRRRHTADVVAITASWTPDEIATLATLLGRLAADAGSVESARRDPRPRTPSPTASPSNKDLTV